MEQNRECQYKSDNKRIAKNTLLLYFRQILILLITLYTSRVVLRELGADDYGIYNVVGGFVAMFNVISGAFSVAISRYMAYVLGQGDKHKLQKLYATALWIQFALGLVISALLATVGSWYVCNIMVMDESRTGAALWVLLFSAVSFFVGLLSVPYNSLIIAHEHMKAFAYIAVVEAVLKLLVALFLAVIPADKLVIYGFMTLCSTMIVRALYARYCKKHFPECVFEWKVDRGLFKEMTSFVGWAFLGNGAVVLRDQGITMIINAFAGTTANAARGIAQSVNNAVTSFVNNFMQAVQPQITKLNSTNQLKEMCSLICRSCRLSFYLMFFISVPLMKNLDYVLNLWLGEVPVYTEKFIIFTLMDSLVVSINNPLLYGTLAEGNIKTYEIVMSILNVMNLPLAIMVLSRGCSPVSVYVVIIAIRIAVMFVLIWQSYRYGMTVRYFIGNVLGRVALVIVCALAGCHFVRISMPVHGFLNFIVESILICLITGGSIFLLGISKAERGILIVLIRKILCKQKSI